MYVMWTETYRPETLSDFQGSTKTINQVREWLEDWSRDQKKKALLLHGPPGTGKTSLAHALSNDYDMELFETNASEARTKQNVQENLMQAVKQMSFTGKQKLILVDEVDGMGRGDRGGKQLITDVLKETRFPIIVTANDPYASGMRSIRNNCEVIDLGNVHTNSIRARLRSICEEENVGYEDGALKAIARRANGDMRSAINDLEIVARQGAVTQDAVRVLGYRETERDIFEALKIVFKTTTARTASNATNGVAEDYDMFFEWVRENVPREYKKRRDVAEAFDSLAKADMFRGRVIRRQEWGLLKYVYAFMTTGVALAKQDKYEGFTKYAYPSRIRKMGQSKAARAKRESIGAKVGDEMHVSVSEAVDMLPFLRLLFQDEDWKQDIVSRLQLEEDEVEFIEAL